MDIRRKLADSRSCRYFLLMALAVASAFNYIIFIFPNNFAPAGINGVITMIQYVFQFSAGYMSLIINLPMLLVAFFVLNRRFAVGTLIYIVTFSVTLVFLQEAGFEEIVFTPTDTGSSILGAVAGGLFSGVIYSMSIRLGGSTGGTDVIAAFIHHRKPEFDIVWVTFLLNVVVALSSFFVYGMNYEAVLLGVIFLFVQSRVGDAIFKGMRSALKFEVITTSPEQLSQELMETLHHGCTVMQAKGMFSNTQRALLICVVNRRQVVDFERIVSRYDDTFAYSSTVNETIGRFRRER